MHACFFSSHFYFPASGQAVVSGVIPACMHACMHACFFCRLTFSSRLLDKLWSQVPSLLPPGTYVSLVFIAHRVQHSHCSSIFIECC